MVSNQQKRIIVIQDDHILMTIPKPSPRKDIVTEKEKELRAQIARIKARKLKGYDEDELRMAVGITTGLSIDQYIRKGLSELHG